MNIPTDSIDDLDAEDLAELTAAALARMTDSWTPLTKSVARDAYGSETITWGTGTAVACCLMAATRYAESVESGGLKAIVTWRAQFPVGTAIHPQDRGQVGTQTYEVVATDAGRTGAAALTAQLVVVGQS